MVIQGGGRWAGWMDADMGWMDGWMGAVANILPTFNLDYPTYACTIVVA